MANSFYRYMFWKGSTGTTGINPYNFNIASNWMEYKVGKDGKWYWLYITPAPTSLAPSGYSGLAGATMSGAPSYTDNVYIGSNYPAPSVIAGAGSWCPLTNLAWGTTTKAALSPCLYGGFSGNTTGGTDCWPNGQIPSGTTFTSNLNCITLGSANGAEGNASTCYPFPYIGYGITGAAVTELQTTKGFTDGGSVLGAAAANAYAQKPIKIKSRKWLVMGLATPKSVVKAVSAKNWVSFSGGTGATAKYGAYSDLTITNMPSRNGSIVFEAGSYFSTITQIQSGTPLGHNTNSEAVAFNGTTADSVSLMGGNYVTFDPYCVIGNIEVKSGYYNGPIWFRGQLSTKDVRADLYAGLTGATGNAAADSSIIVQPLIEYSTKPILGVYTNESIPYRGAATDNVPTRSFPSIYVGGSVTNTMGRLIDIKSSPTGLGTDKAVSGATWRLKFAGGVTFAQVNLLNAYVCASGGNRGTYQEGDKESIDPKVLISIGNLSGKGGSVIDQAYNSSFTRWQVGSPSCGLVSTNEGGGEFDDTECSILCIPNSAVFLQPFTGVPGGNGSGIVIDRNMVRLGRNSNDVNSISVEPQ